MQLHTELQNLMVNYNFKPNRRMSQNFVVDKGLIQQMIDFSRLKKSDIVLEIGAGTGFLTRQLLKQCSVVAVEKDHVLFKVLDSELPKENLSLLRGDFLDLELPKFNKVICFPPYGISSDILYKIFNYDFDLALFVFQQEFVFRVTAEPGFFDYNALSIITNYYTEPEVLIERISPDAFYPKPGGISSLVLLKAKKRFGKVKDEKKFIHFVKQIFRLKNKNLSNALCKSFQFISSDLKMNEKKFKQKISELKYAEIKVYNLSVRQIVEVYKLFYE